MPPEVRAVYAQEQADQFVSAEKVSGPPVELNESKEKFLIEFCHVIKQPILVSGPGVAVHRFHLLPAGPGPIHGLDADDAAAGHQPLLQLHVEPRRFERRTGGHDRPVAQPAHQHLRQPRHFLRYHRKSTSPPGGT